MKFTIRDLFWLILCIALGLALHSERGKNARLTANAVKMRELHAMMGLKVTDDAKLVPGKNFKQTPGGQHWSDRVEIAAEPN